jgi:alpha-L-fucosidase
LIHFEQIKPRNSMKNKLILMTCGLLTSALAQDASQNNPATPGDPAGLLQSLANAVGVAPENPAATNNAPDLKFGLYIHYGIATFAHPGEQGLVPAERFAPTALDVKAWVHTAKEAGMTFAVLTVKHESGFCLWDSPGYGYDVAQSPFKGDIIGDFIAACNAEGILPGVHYSIPDAFNEGKARFRGPVSPVYFAQIKKHLTELHTRYPGIRIQKIDGIGRLSPEQFAEIKELIKQLNPNCVLLNNSRLPERGLGCNDDSIIKGWMWSPQAQLFPVQTLFDHYSWAEEAGRAYALNVGPDTTGRIPDDQMAILTQLKNMITTQPLTPPTAPAQPPAAQPSAADRLKQLKSLYDQGLINKNDYDRKSKEILDSL